MTETTNETRRPTSGRHPLPVCECGAGAWRLVSQDEPASGEYEGENYRCRECDRRGVLLTSTAGLGQPVFLRFMDQTSRVDTSLGPWIAEKLLPFWRRGRDGKDSDLVPLPLNVGRLDQLGTSSEGGKGAEDEASRESVAEAPGDGENRAGPSEVASDRLIFGGAPDRDFVLRTGGLPPFPARAPADVAGTILEMELDGPVHVRLSGGAELILTPTPVGMHVAAVDGNLVVRPRVPSCVVLDVER